MKEVKIPIKGMHCSSCEVLITEELQALPGVKKAEVSLRTRTATVRGKHLPPQSAIAQAIKTAGYEVGYDQQPVVTKDKRVYKDLLIGLTVTFVLFLLFAKLGLGDVSDVNLNGASISVVALVIGLTAGFSTCMALIGGLVLGISSRHAQKHPSASSVQKFRPHLYFNLGRIVSFIVLGGVIGALGAAFQLKGGLLGIVTVAVGIVMLFLGLQLTELFPGFKTSFTLPGNIGKAIGIKKHSNREYSHGDAFGLGALTFFLPCGFTQAMQLYAVSTGSWSSGALIMGMFAVGTTPGLLSIGGLTSVVKGTAAKRFFRIVGVVVVAMALLNLSNGARLLGLGVIFSRATPPKSASQQKDTPAVVLTTNYSLEKDIQPNVFTTKVGQKTSLVVNVKEDGVGCMSTIMIPGLDNNSQFLKGGKKITLTFTPKRAGTYQITCAMGIPRGTVKVEP